MVMYATAAELASYLQQDVDTSSAALALTVASAQFSARARTWWAPQTATYTTAGTLTTSIELPHRQVTTVTAVRVNGVPLPVDYTLRRGSVYRLAGFGDPYAFPPDLVEIDYTHGYTTVPDDVKGAVLEVAAAMYCHPDSTVTSESIDDYTVKMSSAGVRLPQTALDLADYYRGVLVA